MKNLSRLLAVCLLLVGLGKATAQNENNPWEVAVGINAVDTYPAANPESSNFLGEFFNVGDHYNIAPTISLISVKRYVGNGFSVGVTGTFNQIDKLGDTNLDKGLSYYGVDGALYYSLNTFIKSSWFEPFLGAGAGYTRLEGLDDDRSGFGHAIAQGGLKFWLSDAINLSVATARKQEFKDYGVGHWQHTAAMGIAFGGKDTDGDGIYDSEDACPEVAGLPQFNGCPDTDGDGIEDSKDDCPTVAGTAAFNGCPDTDGDGIPDPKDACPTVAGVAALGGCPDADGDGVKDSDDNCPNEAGPRENQGCPWKDSDGDGILDKDDACPNEAGVASRNGCPEPKEISVEVLNELNVEIKSVLFDLNKATIRKESLGTLDNIASIMNQYPDSKFLVEGHTDSQGRDEYNLKLSNDRAASVKNYLISKGISASRINSRGFGETRPVASNNTAAGRQANRRVELSLED